MFRDSIYKHTNENSLIICNGEIFELTSNIWGKRKLILLKRGMNLPAQKSWLANLIRFDKPEETKKFLELRDSLMTRYHAKLVDSITGIDKRFELYELSVDNHFDTNPE
jgi:hypothetical protein